MTRVNVWVTVFVILMLGTVVLSRSQHVSPLGSSDGVKVDPNITDYRSALDGGEGFAAIGSGTSGGGGVSDVTTVTCGGYATVSVPVLFSDGAGATVLVTAVRYHWDGTTLTFQGSENLTVTGQQVYTVSGRYPGIREAEFATKGASVIKILAADPSTGTVTLGPVRVY